MRFFFHAIAACYAQALGGHPYQCVHCWKEHFVPDSCVNRHCSTCQKLNSASPYFHVVFTLPHELNPLIQYNQQKLYSLLFSSASATLM